MTTEQLLILISGIVSGVFGVLTARKNTAPSLQSANVEHTTMLYEQYREDNKRLREENANLRAEINKLKAKVEVMEEKIEKLEGEN